MKQKYWLANIHNLGLHPETSTEHVHTHTHTHTPDEGLGQNVVHLCSLFLLESELKLNLKINCQHLVGM